MARGGCLLCKTNPIWLGLGRAGYPTHERRETKPIRKKSGEDAQPSIRSRAGSTKRRSYETKPICPARPGMGAGGRAEESEMRKTNPIPGDAGWDGAPEGKNAQNEPNSRQRKVGQDPRGVGREANAQNEANLRLAAWHGHLARGSEPWAGWGPQTRFFAFGNPCPCHHTA